MRSLTATRTDDSSFLMRVISDPTKQTAPTVELEVKPTTSSSHNHLSGFLTTPHLPSSRTDVATMASLAKLTSQSTQTLSLLLERQRLQTLSSAPANSLHLPQIARNLKQLRAGIIALEEKEGANEAVRLLKSQYERMRSMLGSDGDAAGVESLRCVPNRHE